MTAAADTAAGAGRRLTVGWGAAGSAPSGRCCACGGRWRGPAILVVTADAVPVGFCAGHAAALSAWAGRDLHGHLDDGRLQIRLDDDAVCGSCGTAGRVVAVSGGGHRLRLCRGCFDAVVAAMGDPDDASVRAVLDRERVPLTLSEVARWSEIPRGRAQGALGRLADAGAARSVGGLWETTAGAGR